MSRRVGHILLVGRVDLGPIYIVELDLECVGKGVGAHLRFSHRRDHRRGLRGARGLNRRSLREGHGVVERGTRRHRVLVEREVTVTCLALHLGFVGLEQLGHLKLCGERAGVRRRGLLVCCARARTRYRCELRGRQIGCSVRGISYRRPAERSKRTDARHRHWPPPGGFCDVHDFS